jgi:hypothetical protein
MRAIRLLLVNSHVNEAFAREGGAGNEHGAHGPDSKFGQEDHDASPISFSASLNLRG